MVAMKPDAEEETRTPRPSSEAEVGRFGERLREAIGTRSVRSFGRAAGVSDTVLRKYLAGQSEPGRAALVAMAEAAGVSVEWLATGRGPKQLEDLLRLSTADGSEGAGRQEVDAALLEDVLYAVDSVLSEMAVELPPEGKAKVVRLLYEMHSQHGGEIQTETVGRVIELALYRR